MSVLLISVKLACLFYDYKMHGGCLHNPKMATVD